MTLMKGFCGAPSAVRTAEAFKGGNMSDKKHVRLLVVDDQRSFFEAIAEQAELCRHQLDIVCRYANSMEDVEDVLDEWQPSVTLVNAHNMEVDCFEVLSRCKEGEVPVIVTSDHCSQEIEDASRSLGATGYVTKSEAPEDVEGLLHQIEAAAGHDTAIH